MTRRLAAILIASAVALVGARSASADAEHPWTVSALYSEGASITLERRVQNNAGPIVEGRIGYELEPWLVPDLGLALNAFPDQVAELRPGARLIPFAGTPYARALFARLGAHGLVSIDGFDIAPDLEIGTMLETDRVFAYVAGQAGAYLVRPRVTLGFRLGFGARF